MGGRHLCLIFFTHWPEDKRLHQTTRPPPEQFLWAARGLWKATQQPFLQGTFLCQLEPRPCHMINVLCSLEESPFRHGIQPCRLETWKRAGRREWCGERRCLSCALCDNRDRGMGAPHSTKVQYATKDLLCVVVDLLGAIERWQLPNSVKARRPCPGHCHVEHVSS